MKQVRKSRRPQLSTAISAVAIFISLGGTATAAIVLTGNSVRNGSLTGADFKSGSIGKAELAKGAIGARGRHGDSGPAGPEGPFGSPGTDGGSGADSSEPGRAGPYGQTVVRWVGVVHMLSIQSQVCQIESKYTPPAYSTLPSAEFDRGSAWGSCKVRLSPDDAGVETTWGTVTASDPAGVAKVTLDRHLEEWGTPYFRLWILDASGQPTSGRVTVVLYTSAKEPTL